MYVIIMGCGRLGAELATRLEEDGHEIAILDIDKYAFDHLPVNFKGKKILGDGTDQNTLRRAQAERAGQGRRRRSTTLHGRLDAVGIGRLTRSGPIRPGDVDPGRRGGHRRAC